MKKTLLTATALTALSFSAFAADLPARTVAPMAPAPIFSWTGFYVGGSVGVVNQSTKHTDIEGNNDSQGDTFGSGGSGAIGGLNVGYNYQINNFVIGAEADVSVANASGDTKIGIDTYIYKANLSMLSTYRVRVGYAVGRALVYATGGYAYANMNHQHDYYSGGNVFTAKKDSVTGWVAGAGVEYALTNNWTVRAEGLYLNLNKSTSSYFDSMTFPFEAKSNAVLARVGVNYKF